MTDMQRTRKANVAILAWGARAGRREFLLLWSAAACESGDNLFMMAAPFFNSCAID
jgi:hypothetical protein